MQTMKQIRNPFSMEPQQSAAQPTQKDIAVALAVEGARAHAISIVNACNAAGKGYLASDFMRRNLTAQQVEFALAFGEAKPWGDVLRAAGIHTKSAAKKQ